MGIRGIFFRLFFVCMVLLLEFELYTMMASMMMKLYRMRSPCMLRATGGAITHKGARFCMPSFCYLLEDVETALSYFVIKLE